MSLPESKRNAAEPQPNRGTAILAVSVTGGTPVPQRRGTPCGYPEAGHADGEGRQEACPYFADGLVTGHLSLVTAFLNSSWELTVGSSSKEKPTDTGVLAPQMPAVKRLFTHYVFWCSLIR